MIKRLIERPIAVTMCVIAVVVLGIISMRYLPISLMPNVDIPQITIHVSGPGMSVREVNDQLLRPLRSQLSQVVGLSGINSQARSDAGVINLDFEPDTDMDVAFIEVNEKMDRAARELPEDIDRPKIIKANITDIPAFYLNVSLNELVDDQLQEADIRFVQLGGFVRDVVAKRIEQLPQTAMADISGVITPELLCIPDYKKLTSMGVDVDLLAQQIDKNNLSLSSLSIRDGEFRYNIQFDAQITTKEEIENIYINHEGRLYQFKELCQVIERPTQRTGLVRSGRSNAVSVAIIKQSDARMDDLQEQIDILMTDLKKEYPNLTFELTRDQTKLLSYSIDSLGKNLILGAILASFVIFVFMGDVRSPVLIIITIPLSLILTLLAFYGFGISINIISLSGLILGVGMMVDNSIIVIDNILQRWDSQTELKQAIASAVSEVFTPMLSSILTTCSIFLPLIFLSGVAGALFYDQAMAVSIALICSLMVSVLVLPVYFYVMYRKRNRIQSMFNSRINLYRPYEVALGWTLRNAKLVLGIFLLTIPASYLMYRVVDKSDLPAISYDDTIVQVDWNSQISLEESDRRIDELLSFVAGECEQSTSMIGTQQFMMSHTPNITSSEAVVYIKAHDSESLKRLKEVFLSTIKASYPQSVVEFSTSGNIFDMIFTDNQSDLIVNLKPQQSSAPKVEDVVRVINLIQETIPQVYIPSPVLEENIIYATNAEAVALYKLSYDQIYAKMRNIVSQNSLFRINQGSYSVPVITGDSRAEVEDVLSSKVRNSDGVDVPLSLVVEQRRGEDFKQLHSDNGGDYYPIYISANDSQIQQIIQQVDSAVERDGSFFATYSGEYFSSRELVGELAIILLVAIALLYFILAAQFESIIQPLIILLEIVVDIFFVLLGLWAFGQSLNLMSLIGIVVMSGIIINDSILKVDTINRLRKEGYSLLRAIYMGGHKRLKPIVMTSLTTILAIVPLLNHRDMGSDLQYPLSLAIVIGMSFGTLVSLLFIPLVYHAIYKKR